MQNYIPHAHRLYKYVIYTVYREVKNHTENRIFHKIKNNPEGCHSSGDIFLKNQDRCMHQSLKNMPFLFCLISIAHFSGFVYGLSTYYALPIRHNQRPCRYALAAGFVQVVEFAANSLHPCKHPPVATEIVPVALILDPL